MNKAFSLSGVSLSEDVSESTGSQQLSREKGRWKPRFGGALELCALLAVEAPILSKVYVNV